MFSVTVYYEGKRKIIKLEKAVSIREVLGKAGINPETVIVRRRGEIVPDNEMVGDKERIEALKIVSGG